MKKSGKHAKWTTEDDEALTESVKLHKAANWKAIALYAFGTSKTDVQCLHRWRKVLDPTIKKGPWTAVEDQLILQGIEQHGEGKWSAIAKLIPGRLGKQCRERWMNHLDPTICKDPFSPEEDKLILELLEQHGTKWTTIRQYLTGRTDNAIKNRYYSHLKRRVDGTPAPARARRTRKRTNKPSRKRRKSGTAQTVSAQPGSANKENIPNGPIPPLSPAPSPPSSKREALQRRNLAKTNIPNGVHLPGSSCAPDDFVQSNKQSTPPSKSRRQSYSPMLKHRRKSGESMFNAYAGSPRDPGKLSATSPFVVRPPMRRPRRAAYSSLHSPRASTPMQMPGSMFMSPPTFETPVFMSPNRTPARRCPRTDSILSSPVAHMTPLNKSKKFLEMLDEVECQKEAGHAEGAIADDMDDCTESDDSELRDADEGASA